MRRAHSDFSARGRASAGQLRFRVLCRQHQLVDLNMPGESGLALIAKLKALDEHTCVVVLTGYASVATAVEAIKLGATHYLAKAADADEIVAAFGLVAGDSAAPISGKPANLN
ncbi:MAG: response regulator [Gammaproteobacteria bacterium]